MANLSAFAGPACPLVALATHAPTSVAAVSVMKPAMVLEAADPMLDPRCVVTPLDPNRVEEILCKHSILASWSYIIDGLHEGFNVGIHKQLSCFSTTTHPLSWIWIS